MPPLPHDVTSFFDSYVAMLDDHIQAVQACEQMPLDLEKLNFERSRAFEDLKTRLMPVLKNAKAEPNERGRRRVLACQDRLALIKKKDRLLAKHLTAYHDMLTMQKHHMLRGKKALRGYHNSSTSPAPRTRQRPG